MNIRNIFILLFACFFILPVSHSSAENAEIYKLLDKVESAMASQEKIEWQAIVILNVKEFDKKSRNRYAYRRMDDSLVDGKPVFVIETKAKELDTETYEGKYYIDKDLYKILKLNIKPSKTPMFIKDLSIEVDFKILPGNLAIIEKTTSRMKGKFLFKSFNVLIEENYTEYEISQMEPDYE